MRYYSKAELKRFITYRGESEHTEWALWIGDRFLFHDGQLQHPEDDLGLPVFNPYKDPVL